MIRLLRTQRQRIIFSATVVPIALLNGCALLQLLIGGGARGFLIVNAIWIGLALVGGLTVLLATWIDRGEKS